MANANYDKLDMLVDLIDPMTEIITDPEALLLWKAGKRAEALKRMIGAHKAAVVRALAIIEGEDPERYQIDGGVLLLKLIAKWNELQQLADALFPSSAQSAGGASSGPATASIAESAI